MLFLEYFFLNCNSEIELQKNSLIKGSATCLIQKKEENIDFYISENFQIEEIFFTRGGTSLYYEKKETQNDNYSIILTGGFGKLLSPKLKIKHILDEHLTLKGLLHIHSLNA